jgi:hypothetical protein
MYGLGQIKEAFIDPASMGGMPAGGMPMGTPIPAGAPPMDPAMMGGAPPMDPAMMGGAPPVDPAMMGGAPPMDPAMMGGAPPMDPSTAAMGDQEAIRSVIREEIQKAVSGDGGQGIAAGGKKGGNKFDDAIGQLKREMQQQMKVFALAMRKAGIEIPLADLLSMDGSVPSSPDQQAPGPGTSEVLQPGATGMSEEGGIGKIAEVQEAERQIEMLRKLADAKDALKRSVLGAKITRFNPQEADISFLNGLYC